ncbi:MAG TPA: hypothetical protein PLR43_03430 [Syntrophales bacterium]|nr:hypothetical protein [Syntrophales bacterium]
MDRQSGDPALVREFQKRLERALREKEISVLIYWKERLDRLIALKPDGIASLQLELKKISEAMGNRTGTLKKEGR